MSDPPYLGLPATSRLAAVIASMSDRSGHRGRCRHRWWSCGSTGLGVGPTPPAGTMPGCWIFVCCPVVIVLDTDRPKIIGRCAEGCGRSW